MAASGSELAYFGKSANSHVGTRLAIGSGMTSKRTLTAYGVRSSLWDLLSESVSPRTATWFESDLVTQMGYRGATKRQTVNAILAKLDDGDLVVSPGRNPAGHWEPEYRIAAHCFGKAA